MHTAHRPVMPRSHAARSAFALNGLVVVLTLLLVGLVVWKGAIYTGHIPANHPLYASLVSKFVTSHILVVLASAAIAGGLGALAYFVAGKSDSAANAAMCIVLLLPNGVVGYQLYNYFSGGLKTTASAPSTSPAPPTTPTTPAPTQLPTASPAPAVASQPRPRPSPRPRTETPAPSISPPSPAAAAPTPTETTPAPRSHPAAAPPSTTDTSPAIRSTTDSFAAELDGQVNSVVEQAGKLLPDLARAPAHDLTKIRKRLEDIQALRAAAADLGARLGRASDDLRQRLIDAGVPEPESRPAAFRWASTEYHVTPRTFGTDAIVRLCDRAQSECENLRDTIGKWTLDAKGELKSTDAQFLARARSTRFFVKSEADRKDWIVDQLRGH